MNLKSRFIVASFSLMNHRAQMIMLLLSLFGQSSFYLSVLLYWKFTESVSSSNGIIIFIRNLSMSVGTLSLNSVNHDAS